MSPFGRSSQSDQGPRTAEDRERARLEREARRAAREGRPMPAFHEPDDGTGNGHVDLEEPQPQPVTEEPEPVTEEPEPVAEEPEPVAEEPEPVVVEPVVVEPDPVAQEPVHVDDPEPEPVAAHEPAEDTAFLDAPPPASASEEFASIPVAEDPEGPAANEAPMPHGSQSRSDAPAAEGPQETVEWDVLRNGPKEPAGEPRITRATPAPAAAAPIVPPAARRAAASRYGDEDERPVPPKRVPRQDRTLPPPPPPPGERRGSSRRGRRIGVAVVLLLLLGAGGWLANALYQPFAGDPGERVSVEIPEQSTAADIGRLLQNEGVVRSSTFFALRSRLDGGNLKAGTYQLREDMTYGEALDALSAGPPPPRVVNLTIPEGRSRRETRPLVLKAGLRGSYLQASERSRGFSPRRYGAPRDVASLEGFLFPATYELPPGATSRQLVRKQLEAFEENIKGVSMRRARARNLDTYDVLIIASMVEREATLAKERPLVASVIYNRLRQGMPLGIDATIRFATRNWTRPLRVSELETDSPYNTRKRTGLPPGPIGSPGLASIKAAANPAKSDFLFYVVKPNGDGAHSFSATDAEFQRDVAAYNRERERRGGNDPSSSDGG